MPRVVESRNAHPTSFEGSITESVYSDFGFLDELRYYAPGSDPGVDSPDETVDYTYNSLDQRSQITDSRGDTDYTYHEFDCRQIRFVRAYARQVEVNSPDDGSAEFRDLYERSRKGPLTI